MSSWTRCAAWASREAVCGERGARVQPLLSATRCACPSPRAQHVRVLHIPPTPPKRTFIQNVKSQRGTIGAALAIAMLAGGLVFMQRVTQERAKEEERSKKLATFDSEPYGRPNLGGPFRLVLATQDPTSGQAVGRKITHQDLLGRFALIYFGFTNCPDICPEELEKMSSVVGSVENRYGDILTPVFITCDPARDTIPKTAKYASEYHPKLLGLTGHWDDIKAVCKAYRVYFSTPPSADPDSDYLVDHSIFFYLMDPEGRFVEVFGRASDVPEVRTKVMQYIKQWKDAGLPISKGDVKETLTQDRNREVTSLAKPLSLTA